MKKELQRKEKLLESQKNEVSKMTKYLDALTEVRQLREKANWKAGIESVYSWGTNCLSKGGFMSLRVQLYPAWFGNRSLE